MKKFALALALGTGLAASNAYAGASAPISTVQTFQSLSTTPTDAATFNSQFTSVSNPLLQAFRFAGSSTDSGLVESQVFKYNGATTDGNPLYAYAYQVAVNPTPAGGDPAHVDSLSFKFNATGLGGGTGSSYGYMISNGSVGGLNLAGTQTPTSLTFQPDATTGYIRALYVNPTTGVGPVGAGTNSATFVLLSKEAPATVLPTVNIGGPEAVTSANPPQVYVPSGGNIEPAPVPEPATVLAWAGVIGAAALYRRGRKARAAVA
jgi:hypothetical protein